MKLKNSLLPACCCAAALLLSGCGMGNSSSTADDPALANNPNYDVPVYENSPSAVKLQPENKVEERDLPPSAGAAAPAQTTPYMQRRAAAGAAHPAAAPV
ncbi:MAG: hypothetical protein J6I57_06415, partial [Desulfovibrio sp.]|nr:hypothetical protein [Desulfovibrio sp.]